MTGIVEQDQGAGGFTPDQQEVIDAVSGAFDGTEPQDVVLAGYGLPKKQAVLLRSDKVQAELLSRRTARLRGPMAERALRAIDELLNNDKTPAATRFSAAKWVLEQAGHNEGQDEGKDKPLHEMTEAELLAFMEKAQKVVNAGGDAPTITVTPDNGA